MSTAETAPGKRVLAKERSSSLVRAQNSGARQPVHMNASTDSSTLNLIQMVYACLYHGSYRATGFPATKEGISMLWFLQLPNMVGRGPLLGHTLKALGLAHLGKSNGDRHTLHQARLAYGEAVKAL